MSRMPASPDLSSRRSVGRRGLLAIGALAAGLSSARAAPCPSDSETTRPPIRQGGPGVLSICSDSTPVGNEQHLLLDAAGFVALSSDAEWQLDRYAPDDRLELQAKNWGGYVFDSFGPGSNSYNYWAPVNLPSGTRITRIGLAARSTGGDPGTLYAALRQFNADGTREPDLAFVDAVVHRLTWDSTYAEVELTAPVDIDNGGGRSYAVMVRLEGGVLDLGDGLRGVRLGWKRQIAPSPSIPTFPDVPDTHPFYCYIEALAKSEITGGCAPCVGSDPRPCFCPDNPLTRAQMAVFLSLALGLDWPF